MKVFCFSGWRGSGKDVCASYLVDNHNFERRAFADKLKDICAEQYGVDRAWFDDPDCKEAPLLDLPAGGFDAFTDTVLQMIFNHLRTDQGTKPVALFKDSNGYYWSREGFDREPLYHTPRSLAVLEGSIKRCVDPNYWVKRAVDNVKADGNYVISDLRFKSEVEGLAGVIGRENLVCVRVLRFENTEQTDASERDMDDFKFDHYIDNSEARQVPKEIVFKQLDAILNQSKKETA